jgi:DNA-binding NtrC family response regulator
MPDEILVVDDDPNTRLNFRITLELEGYKILRRVQPYEHSSYLQNRQLLW